MNDSPICRSTSALIFSASASPAVCFRSAFRWKLRRAAVDRDLVEPFVLDVFQLGFAEVVDHGALGQLVSDQRARRLRERDLAIVEPSMSVKTNVTVPAGNAVLTRIP